MSLDWDLAVASFSAFVEGVLEVAVDMHGVADQSGRGLPSVQPLGLLSRPMDPTPDPVTGAPGAGASCLFAFDGNSGEGFSMPTTDSRLVGDIPPISKGSTVLYAKGSFFLQDAETKTAMLFQRVGESKGQAMAMVGKEGEESFQIRLAHGAGIVFDKDGSVTINDKSGSGMIRLDGKGGILISGTLQQAGGAVLGDVAGAQPVSLFPANASALAAIGTALSAISAIPANAAAAAAVGAAITAIGVASAPATGGTTKVSLS